MTTSQRPIPLARSITMAALAVLALATCATAETPASSSALKNGVLLTGSYDPYVPEVGFGFDPASLERLPDMLVPDEVLKVEVNGVARRVDEIEWGVDAQQGRFPLVAVAKGGSARRVGELEVSAVSQAACKDTSDAEAQIFGQAALDRRVKRSDSRFVDYGPNDPIPIGSCVNGNIYRRCLNCQCRSGIYVRGRNKHYMCMYGWLYPQTGYTCDCEFTSHICGGGQT